MALEGGNEHCPPRTKIFAETKKVYGGNSSAKVSIDPDERIARKNENCKPKREKATSPTVLTARRARCGAPSRGAQKLYKMDTLHQQSVMDQPKGGLRKN